MVDIVAIETAKAREQAERFVLYLCSCVDEDAVTERIVTALLEAKADVLDAVDEEDDLLCDERVLLRQEVTNRRLRGL